jgi:hypothetical protein
MPFFPILSYRRLNPLSIFFIPASLIVSQFSDPLTTNYDKSVEDVRHDK